MKSGLLTGSSLLLMDKSHNYPTLPQRQNLYSHILTKQDDSRILRKNSKVCNGSKPRFGNIIGASSASGVVTH